MQQDHDKQDHDTAPQTHIIQSDPQPKTPPDSQPGLQPNRKVPTNTFTFQFEEMHRALEDAKRFLGTVRVDSKHLATGDILSYEHKDYERIAHQIRVNHTEFSLRQRTPVHMTEGQPNSTKMRFTCPCGRGDSATVDLTLEELPCAQCGKIYSNQASLTRHMRAHTENKSHACRRCPSTFFTNHELQRHEKIHRGKITAQPKVALKRQANARSKQRAKKKKKVVQEAVSRTVATRELLSGCNFSIHINWQAVNGRFCWVVGKVERAHCGHYPNKQVVRVVSAKEREEYGRQMNSGLTARQVAALNNLDDGSVIPSGLLRSLKQTYVQKTRDGLDAIQTLIRNLRQLHAQCKVKYVLKFSRTQPEQGLTQSVLNAASVENGDHPSKAADKPEFESRCLVAAAWVRTEFIEKAARFPELMSMDCTCKTNNERRPLCKIHGLDGEGHTFPWCNALLWDESEPAFTWLLEEALPNLHSADVLCCVSTIVSDGDLHECAAIDHAITALVIPKAKRRRCYWHKGALALAQKFGIGHWDAEELGVVRGWLNYLAYVEDDENAFQSSVQSLLSWIRANYDYSLTQAPRTDTQLQQSRGEALEEFVKGMEKLKEFWSKPSRMGLRDLAQITSNISESGNAVIKKNGAVNPKTAVDDCVKTIDEIELNRVQNHAVTADRRVNTRAMPVQTRHLAVEQMSTFLCKYSVERFLEPEYNSHNGNEVRRVESSEWDAEWEVLFIVSGEPSGLETGQQTPWKVSPKIRRVYLHIDGTLRCSCQVFESTLSPCNHQIAVKNGELCLQDFHFRHYASWQSGHLSVQQFPRSFGDGPAGPTILGVDMRAPVTDGFSRDQSSESDGMGDCEMPDPGPDLAGSSHSQLKIPNFAQELPSQSRNRHAVLTNVLNRHLAGLIQKVSPNAEASDDLLEMYVKYTKVIESELLQKHGIQQSAGSITFIPSDSTSKSNARSRNGFETKRTGKKTRKAINPRGKATEARASLSQGPRNTLLQHHQEISSVQNNGRDARVYCLLTQPVMYVRLTATRVAAILCPDYDRRVRGVKTQYCGAGVKMHTILADMARSRQRPKINSLTPKNTQRAITFLDTELQAHPNHIAMVEQRMFLQLDTNCRHSRDRPYIAGSSDLLLFERPTGSKDCSRAHLFDWKSGSITKEMINDVQKGIFDNKLGAGVIQLNIYCYILQKTYGITILRCELVYFSASKMEQYTVPRQSDSTIESWLGRALRASDAHLASAVTITSEQDAKTEAAFEIHPFGTTRPKGRPSKEVQQAPVPPADVDYSTPSGRALLAQYTKLRKDHFEQIDVSSLASAREDAIQMDGGRGTQSAERSGPVLTLSENETEKADQSGRVSGVVKRSGHSLGIVTPAAKRCKRMARADAHAVLARVREGCIISSIWGDVWAQGSVARVQKSQFLVEYAGEEDFYVLSKASFLQELVDGEAMLLDDTLEQ